MNRYRKGVYVNESIEAISSAISSCPQEFDSVAVPFPSTFFNLIFENLGISKALYERNKDGESTKDIVLPDDAQLKNILMDLATPSLWEAMKKDRTDVNFVDIMKHYGLVGKHKLKEDQVATFTAIGVLTNTYSDTIEEAGLSTTAIECVLGMMTR